MEKENWFGYCLMGSSGGELTEMPILLEKGSKFIYKDDTEYTVIDVVGDEKEYRTVHCVRSYVLRDELYDSIKAFWLALKDIVVKHKSFDDINIIIEMNNLLACYCLSDRESTSEEQSGIRDNLSEMLAIIKDLIKEK
jgi:hypothetical protein